MEYKIQNVEVVGDTIITTVKYFFKNKEVIADVHHFNRKTEAQIIQGILNMASTVNAKDDSTDDNIILAASIVQGVKVDCIKLPDGTFIVNPIQNP